MNTALTTFHTGTQVIYVNFVDCEPRMLYGCPITEGCFKIIGCVNYA